MNLLIVIVNYKTADLTIDCLRALLQEVGADPAVGVTISDNASNDGSVERIRAFIEQQSCAAHFKLMPLSRNGGFAHGNNCAIAPTQTEHHPKYVLMLNPDAMVRPGA